MPTRWAWVSDLKHLLVDLYLEELRAMFVVMATIVTNDKPWDKIEAQLLNRNDDLVVTKAKLTATFFSDPAMTQQLNGMPLVWEGLDADEFTGTVVGVFDGDHSPSPYMKAYVEPSRLYSHTGK